MGHTVTVTRPDGGPVTGYLAEPAQPANAPGLVVIQEWWGLNDQIRGVADRLAIAGYQALVPDLYRGKSTVESEEANHLMIGLDFGVWLQEPESWPHYLEDMQLAFSVGERFTCVARLQREDGEQFFAELSANPIDPRDLGAGIVLITTAISISVNPYMATP